MIKTYFYSFIILCLLSLYISLTCNLKAPCIYLSISYMHYRLSNPFGSSQDIFPSDSRINNNRFISSKIWTLCLSVYRYHRAFGSQSLIDHSDNNSQRYLHYKRHWEAWIDALSVWLFNIDIPSFCKIL